MKTQTHQQTSEHQQLTKQEQATAKNLKTGLYIMLILCTLGGAIELFTK